MSKMDRRDDVVHLKNPAAGKRDKGIPPEDHARILGFTRDQDFRDLCDFCFLTGAPCAEALSIEDRRLDLTNHRIAFPPDEEKMERAARIIYLNDQAEAPCRQMRLPFVMPNRLPLLSSLRRWGLPH